MQEYANGLDLSIFAMLRTRARTYKSKDFEMKD